jgi:hypothetical protein
MLLKWKTTEFRQLHMNELNDFAQNLHRKILKMSREYKVMSSKFNRNEINIHLGEKLGYSRFSSLSY